MSFCLEFILSFYIYGCKWWKLAFQSRCVKIAMLPLTAIGHFGILWEQIFIFFVCKNQIANYNPGQIHARWLHRQRPLRRRPRKPAPLPLSIMTKILGKSRATAHAPTKYESNSTSGRGARVSYQTMLPEISARRSLLEPSFRYLSPGREGEKCRPPDHTWQNPFVLSARLIIGSNCYIYNSTLVISSMWYFQVHLAAVHI